MCFLTKKARSSVGSRRRWVASTASKRGKKAITTISTTSLETRAKSISGGEKGRKAERHSLIPLGPLDEIARVYDYGSRKYDDHNWRKGYPWSWSYDALQRHLRAFWGNQELDLESGLPHLAHAAFHILALLEWSKTKPEMDDRYRKDL